MNEQHRSSGAASPELLALTEAVTGMTKQMAKLLEALTLSTLATQQLIQVIAEGESADRDADEPVQYLNHR